jgi:hypothetical protein
LVLVHDARARLRAIMAMVALAVIFMV